MAGDVNYTVFDTRAGWVGLSSSPCGLLAVTFPRPTPDEALKLLGVSQDSAVDSPQLFRDLAERLRRYFDGQEVAFPDRLDLTLATAFQRQVWAATRLIPCGETRSYGWVARQIGKPAATRAVGQALGQNPFPIVVPCHRVLASDGGLGGFGGGLEMKRYLLSLEKAPTGQAPTAWPGTASALLLKSLSA